MTEPVARTTPTTPTTPPAPAGAAGALQRYRVMAWVTGTMLLVLCLEMVLKYVFHLAGYDAAGNAKPVIGSWVAFVHGWIYVVYLATVVQLWSVMRWSLGRLLTMAAAGVVPVMSFVLERRVRADASVRLAVASPASPATPGTPGTPGTAATAGGSEPHNPTVSR